MADILEVYDIKNNTTEDIGDKKSRANVAAAFNTSKTYAINDLTVYNGELHKFTAAHSAGAWNINEVVKTTIENEFIKKSGDTMTGLLKMVDHNIALNKPEADISTTVANSQYCNIGATDKNATLFGYTQYIYYADGSSAAQLAARGKATGATSTFDNSLVLKCYKDGTKAVSLDQDAWLNALGFTDSNWQSLTNSSIYSGTIYYRKFGIFLGFQFRITLAAQLAAENSLKLGTLPSGYRPSKEIGSSCMTFSGLYPRIFGLRITTSGEIYLYSNKEAIPTTISLMINGTYMLT